MPNAELTLPPTEDRDLIDPDLADDEQDLVDPDETGGSPFRTEIYTNGAHVVVQARGDLDLDSAPTLSAAIDDALQTARADGAAVRLDLDGVEFIDSTGLRALLAGQVTAADAGVDLGVDGLSAAARRLLELTDTLERLRRGDR